MIGKALFATLATALTFAAALAATPYVPADALLAIGLAVAVQPVGAAVLVWAAWYVAAGRMERCGW